MISSLIRRLVPAVPTTPTQPATTAAPAAPPPAPSSYFQDGFDTAKATPVSLDGSGKTPPVLPPFLERILPPIGPELVHLDTGWTPQGQGYDAGRGEVLTTYYKENDESCDGKSDVLLSIQDKNTGEETTQVKLGGKGAFPPPSHGGGVSTDGDHVYVSDTDAVYVYTREEIEQAARDGTRAEPSQVMPVPGDTVDPADPDTGLISNGSYMTVKDGYAYVGGYSEDGDGKAGAVWRYKIDETTGELAPHPEGPIRAPDQAQGIAVVDGALLFTTGKHQLVYQPFDERTFTADIDDRHDISNGLIDPYAQGLNIIDGQVWVTYESGSDKYEDKVDHPRTHIQRIPLEQLDLEAAGLTPDDLEG